MFWRRKRTLDDLSEEIQAHLAIESEEQRERGEAPDAEAAARRVFGNVTSVEGAFYEHGKWLFWDQLGRDLRNALRLMRRRPGFSVVVVLTLAMGIGATAAIFGLLDAVLLRPLPYKDPARLAMLWANDAAHGDGEGLVSLPHFRDRKK